MTLGIGDVVRVAITGTAPQTSIWQLVYHYVGTSGAGGSESDFVDAALAQYDLAFDEIDSLVSNLYAPATLEAWVRDTTLQKWNGIGTKAFTGTIGLSAEDPIPHGAAQVGLVVTELARRQGRTFVPGWIESSVDAGLFDSAAAVAMGLYLADFTTAVAFTGAVMTWCTYNTDPTSPYFQTDSPFDGTVILSTICGYQRRRKPLVGI